MYRFTVPQLAVLEEISDEHAVKAAALETDYAAADLTESAITIARVLLMRSPYSEKPRVDFANKTHTRFEEWIDRVRTSETPHLSGILSSWLLGVQSPYINYPVFLYNRSFGRSEEILQSFLTREKNAPGYLSLVFLNLLRQALKLSHTDISRLTASPFSRSASYFNEMMKTHIIDTWLNEKKESLRYYSGETNTVLGLYNAPFTSTATGMHTFNRSADYCFDLGGGFCTSEIERLLGRRVISADLNSPDLNAFDPNIVIRKKVHASRAAIAIDDEEHAAFLEKQHAIEFLPFDVFTHSFPTDADSYAITSIAFMTSTFRGIHEKIDPEIRAARMGNFAVSLFAILRVLELVTLGKTVDLFTIQRASARQYKYKTCLLQWRDGKLVNLVTTDDVMHETHRAERDLAAIYSAINPNNTDFVQLLPISEIQ